MKNPNNSGRCPTEIRYRFLCDTASAKGLTLRQETETCVQPRTFELVHKSTPKGDVPIKGGITREEVTLANDNSVLDLINAQPNPNPNP